MRQQTLGLALAGGGMKGLAHVGVLQVLEDVGLKPAIIAGTSMGAIIGSLYASGLTAAEIAAAVTSQSFLSLLSFRNRGGGVVGTAGLERFLLDHLQQRWIEDLEVPFVALATDLSSGQVVALDKGPLVDIVLASAAVPGAFPPVYLDDHPYVDGGLVANIPLEVLHTRGIPNVIGVRLYPDVSTWSLDQALTSSEPGLLHAPMPKAIVVLRRALDIAQMHQEDQTTANFPPRVLIAPKVSHVHTLDFSHAPETIVAAGVAAAEEHRPELERLHVLP